MIETVAASRIWFYLILFVSDGIILVKCRANHQRRTASRLGAVLAVPVKAALVVPVGHYTGRGGALMAPSCGASRPSGHGSIN